MSISSSIFRRVAVVALVWGLSLFAAEGAFRLAGVRTPNLTEGIYAPFGNRSFRLRPSGDTYVNWYPQGFTVYTDPLGLRVTEEEWRMGTARRSVDVLVTGDSQAFGAGVDYEDSVMGSFATTAAAHGVSVANQAVGGHFLRNQIELLEHLRDEEEMKFRVLLISLTPRGATEPEGYNQVFIQDGSIYSRDPKGELSIKKWLNAHSAVYTVVRNATKNLKPRKERGSSSLEYYRAGDAAAEREERLVALLSECAEIAKRAGARVVLCYLPMSGEPQIEEIARRSGFEDGAFRSDVPATIVRHAAAKLGAGFVDLREPLGRVLEERGSITLEGDAHYGEAASRACGEHIWKSMDWLRLREGN